MSETCAKPATGIFLACIKCGEPEASISVNLASLADECFVCCECEAEYSVGDVEAFLEAAKKWRAVLAWISEVPQFEGEE